MPELALEQSLHLVELIEVIGAFVGELIGLLPQPLALTLFGAYGIDTYLKGPGYSRLRGLRTGVCSGRHVRAFLSLGAASPRRFSFLVAPF